LSIKKQHIIYWLVAGIILLKLTLLPFAQTVNADAVSRIFSSINWMKNPSIITNNFWGPIHFYIHGTALMLWNNQIYTPKIVTLLFAAFTLIPFYFFTKREFNENGALIATFFLAFSPILFRNSFLALSETPYLFFLALTINLLSKGIKVKSNLYILLAGLTITIAGGIRYEAWIMILIFTLILFLLKNWKYIFIFNSTALLFPTYWLISNWITTGDPFYSFNGTYKWALEIMGNNENVDFESYLRRIWYFPFSWIIAIGIPTGYIILKLIISSFSKKKFNKKHILLSLPFIIMFLFFQYNTFKGVLLLQHRYIGSLVILTLPFIAIYFKKLDKKHIKHAFIFGVLTITLSFIYNTSSIKPFPRLEDQTSVEIVNIISKNNYQNNALILDFIGWDKTYFIALQSKLPLKDISITEGAKNSTINFDDIDAKIKSHQSGFILLKKKSALSVSLSEDVLNKKKYKISTQIAFENETLILYFFKKNYLGGFA